MTIKINNFVVGKYHIITIHYFITENVLPKSKRIFILLNIKSK